MFGSIGSGELLLILIIALIVFGPTKLPEIGKNLGKVIGEFRRATGDFQRTIEQEVEAARSLTVAEPPARLEEPAKTAAVAAEPVLTPASDTVAHGVPSDTTPKA
jgi:sec-independent protein translocase protein TatB